MTAILVHILGLFFFDILTKVPLII